MIYSNIMGKPLFAIMLLALLTISVETLYIDSKQVFAQDIKQSVGSVKRFERITSHSPSPYHKIDEAIENQDYAEVNRLFEEFESNPELTIAEKASLAQKHGYICFSINDLHCALTEFKKIVAMRKDIPESIYNHTLYVITQVNFSLEDYTGALLYAQSWFDAQAEPSSDAFNLVSQAYYMLEKYDKALPNALSGIQKVNDIGKIPKEGSLNLLNAIYRKTGQFEKMLPVLEQLIEHYPNEAYQRVKSDVYKELSR